MPDVNIFHMYAIPFVSKLPEVFVFGSGHVRRDAVRLSVRYIALPNIK